MDKLNYVVIGHVTRDLKNGSFTIGGTASYAARTARALGCHVGVVTSASADLDLSQVLNGVRVARHPAVMTTTFENIYTSNGRLQMLHGVAETLRPQAVPPDWILDPGTGIVHLGPVARECDISLVDAFGDAFIGITPQGWMRRWDKNGHVHGYHWENPAPVLARADAVVLSNEDVSRDGTLIARYASQTRVLVVTQGAAGCTVYTSGQSRAFPAPGAREVDPTGAGDIFAAAFFFWLRHSGDPWAAARLANCVAAGSVTRTGLASTPGAEDIAHCKQALETTE